MSLVKLSIIVPVYNTEKYLVSCVESLLQQTCQDIEIILVDDGSTDNSPQICDDLAKRDSRIQVIHKENGGLSSARNAGLAVAAGAYITFVDSDDTVAPDAYRLLINALQQVDGDIVKMSFRRVEEGKSYPVLTPDGICQPKKIENAAYITDICSYRGSCSFCDKVFKREVLGDYRFTQGKNNEDLLLLMTILLENRYDIYEVDFPGYNYLIRSGSITQSKFGATVTDTVYNCRELQQLAKEVRPELYKTVTQLLLYQVRTFLILMPEDYVSRKHTDFVYAYNLLVEHKGYIANAFFSGKDKLFLRLCCVHMGLAKKLIGLLHSNG